jgi:hypothetical protein
VMKVFDINSMDCFVSMPSVVKSFCGWVLKLTVRMFRSMKAELCLDCIELGVTKLSILLDNNPRTSRKWGLS